MRLFDTQACVPEKENPLARSRLEEAKDFLDGMEHDDPIWETVIDALEFLINPEPTWAMSAAAINCHYYKRNSFQDIFKAMIAEATKEDQ